MPGNRFALGVQWHPEADETSRLIAALVAEAAAVRVRGALTRLAAAHGRSRRGPAADLYSRSTARIRVMDTKVTPTEVDPPGPAEDQEDLDDAMPRVHVTRRTVLLFFVLGATTVAFLYFVLPQLASLEEKGKDIGQGDPWWLAGALVFTILSFAGYVAMFRGVFIGDGPRIDLAASYQITMAGLAATRLFAAGGAGGIALTAWALRRAGMDRRKVADKTLAFLILTYAVYMATLVIVGFGLYFDLFSGPAPFAITVVPAIFALIVIALGLALARVPPDLQRRLEGFATRGGRLARLAQRLSNAPAAFSAGMREAVCHVRKRDPRCSARSPTGASTSRRCGRAFTPSATRRRGR